MITEERKICGQCIHFNIDHPEAIWGRCPLYKKITTQYTEACEDKFRRVDAAEK